MNELVWAARIGRDLDKEFEASDSLEAAQKVRGALANHSFDGRVWAEAVQALQMVGLPVEKLSLDSRDQLREAIVRAQIEHLRIYAARMGGDEANASPVDPLFANLQSTAPAPELEASSAPPSSVTIRAASEEYCAQKKDKEWVHKTYLDNRRVLDFFNEVVGGDRLAASLTTSDVKNFRERLTDLPAHAAKRQIVKETGTDGHSKQPKDFQRLSAKTVQKYFALAKSFLIWLENEEIIVKRPGAMVQVAKPSLKEQQDARLAFNADQLRQLFSSPAYTGVKSAARRSAPGSVVIRDGQFWIPLIGLFTGMRLGEIVQLEVSDIGQQGEIPFIHVWQGAAGQKTLKTASSKRQIPIHRELIFCGLLDYVERRRKVDPKGRLFPEVRLGNMGDPSHAFSKQFGRYLDAIGLKSRKLTFHSLRHTFKDALMEAEVPESIAKALMGHSDASVHAIYGSGATLEHLNSAIQKVKYPLKFEFLRQDASVKAAP
ncbi:site-specific integrase [Xanthobacter sp.]|uniref:site-specific integrase n=1 Tax=Xanthobacter sp. TaxID=35809 RepID=UPI0035AD9735